MLWAFKNGIFKLFTNFWIQSSNPFLGDQEETFKRFEFKVCLSKHFRKLFWSKVEVKNECSERWKKHFSLLCNILSDKLENFFWGGKWGKAFKTFGLKLGLNKLSQKKLKITFKNNIFTVLQFFWVMQLKPFSEKAEKVFKTV